MYAHKLSIVAESLCKHRINQGSELDLNPTEARDAPQCDGLSFHRTFFTTLWVFTVSKGLVYSLKLQWCQVSGQWTNLLTHLAIGFSQWDWRFIGGDDLCSRKKLIKKNQEEDNNSWGFSLTVRWRSHYSEWHCVLEKSATFAFLIAFSHFFCRSSCPAPGPEWAISRWDGSTEKVSSSITIEV